jgi:hypothetical protein
VPNKYPVKKGWNVPKQKHVISNWSEYNNALRSRGNIVVWLSQESIDQWYEPDQINGGSGSPKIYTDFAIITCHEMRQVYRLPLRQTEGFINSLFELMDVPLRCPDYTTLSKRLKLLDIKVPRYKKDDAPRSDVHAIAVDSTGLKRFGRDEWHQEKHKVSRKASWRKLHIAVNEGHYIEACTLTDRFHSDENQVAELLDQVDSDIDHFTADGAYDKAVVYEKLEDHSPNANAVIPPREDAVLSTNNHAWRVKNIEAIKQNGRMNWQREQNYGQRNYSELGVQRYKRILGNTLHAKDLDRQKQEAMIGCSVLNKMTSLGMPISRRHA